MTTPCVDQFPKPASNSKINENYNPMMPAGDPQQKINEAGDGFVLLASDPLGRYTMQKALRKAENQRVNLTRVDGSVPGW